MKLKIKDYCIRCGICVTLYPELYEMDYAEDLVRIKIERIPETLLEKAKQSIKDCAVTAIYSTKTTES
jgi:ferredoxin